MIKQIILLFSITSLLSATVIENKTLNNFIPKKGCKEISIKNSKIFNSKIICDKVFLEGNKIKGTTILSSKSMILRNNTISDTKSDQDLINCIDCNEYILYKNEIYNIETPTLSYNLNFGGTIISNNYIHDNHPTNALFAPLNNETMYDIYKGNKVSEIRKNFTKQYNSDIKNGLFNLKEFDNNRAIFSNNVFERNTAKYGIYNIRTWDYFTKSSKMKNISIIESIMGSSYQRKLIQLPLPIFLIMEGNVFKQNYFEVATIATENVILRNNRIEGNVFFNNTLQGYNNSYIDGYFLTGINNLMVKSPYNYNVKNLEVNSVFVNYKTMNSEDMFIYNSLTTKRQFNGKDNIYSKNKNYIYNKMINSNGCAANPFEYVSYDVLNTLIPNFSKKKQSYNYIGRKPEKGKCNYIKELRKSEYSKRKLEKSSFYDIKKIKEQKIKILDRNISFTKTKKSSFDDINFNSVKEIKIPQQKKESSFDDINFDIKTKTVKRIIKNKKPKDIDTFNFN